MATKWSHPAIDGLSDRLDSISADIHGLEEYLARAAVRVEAGVPIEGGGTISWQLCEPDRWRIVFRLGDERRPLIETKTDVRLRAAPSLHSLLTILGNRIDDLGKAP